MGESETLRYCKNTSEETEERFEPSNETEERFNASNEKRETRSVGVEVKDYKGSKETIVVTLEYENTAML